MDIKEKIYKLENARKLMSEVIQAEISQNETWYSNLLLSAGNLDSCLLVLKKRLKNEGENR